MKITLLLSVFLCLTGCAFGTSSEIKIAEQLLNQFQCNNIDSAQLSHSPITGFHERSLAVSKDKAIEFVESYKAGDTLFEIPLDKVIQQQYVTYKSACEFLGGVTLPIDSELTSEAN